MYIIKYNEKKIITNYIPCPFPGTQLGDLYYSSIIMAAFRHCADTDEREGCWQGKRGGRKPVKQFCRKSIEQTIQKESFHSKILFVVSPA